MVTHNQLALYLFLWIYY